MLTHPISGPSKARLEWMDALRGMALTLVILDHALYYASRHAETLPEWAEFTSLLFSPVRMPAMVFLSAMLLSQSLEKGPRRFLAGKVRNILYPFALWAVIYTFIFVLASPVTGGDHDWNSLWEILYAPPAHMWFLHNLFFFYCIMLVAQSVSRLLIAVVALALSAAGMSMDWLEMQRFFFLLAFFALGDYVVQREGLLPALLTNRRVKAGMSLLALGVVATAVLYGDSVRYEPVSVPLAIGGIWALIMFARAVGAWPRLALFRHLGRNSLPAYVVHWMVLATSAMVFSRLVPADQGGIMFGVAVACGLIGTLAAVQVIQRFKLHWLFAWPVGGIKPLVSGAREPSLAGEGAADRPRIR